MSGVIILTGLEAATAADILQGTRLQTVPKNGFLSFEVQASDSDATNFYTCGVQLPDNSNPINAQRVPVGNSTGLAGVIDDRTSLKMRFRSTQGGHCVFNVTETGDAEVAWRVTFTPF